MRINLRSFSNEVYLTKHWKNDEIIRGTTAAACPALAFYFMTVDG